MVIYFTKRKHHLPQGFKVHEVTPKVVANPDQEHKVFFKEY